VGCSFWQENVGERRADILLPNAAPAFASAAIGGTNNCCTCYDGHSVLSLLMKRWPCSYTQENDR